MSAVEDRIVSMKFDNRQFEPAARTSMSTLDRLKAALNFSGSGKGLNDLQNAANRFSLGGLANAATGVSAKFLAMSTIAITAIANITTRALDAGLRIAKAFLIDPVKQGFQEYETNLNAVQTILANTSSAGTKLKDVNAALNELNTYSDKTIYNFSEMARNIGTFTAAGVDLKTSTQAIKGIANLAALSGSNSQQASTAMYQLSQAISSGRVSLQDWNSVVNAGMGGTVFQRALAQTAEKMGTLKKGAVELKGPMKNVSIEGKSFRESITAKPGEQSWLTSKVLTQTLKQFTGDMSDAELKTMGFTAAQIKSIQAQAKTAQEAATQVKTFTQLIDTIKESAGSGWAQTFSILLGDFEEAKALWTEVNNVVSGFLGQSAKARNQMLQQWKDLGGRKALLDSFRNIFQAIVQVVTPIKEAFRDIFPATTGKQLYQMTLNFLKFTQSLKVGSTTLENIKRTARGFFAIFSIGLSIIKGIFGVLGSLFHLVAGGSGGFLEITGTIGDFLVKLDQTIKKGDLVNKFFATIGHILAVPIALIKAFGIALAEMFKGIKEGGLKGLGDSFGRIKDRLNPLAGASDFVSKAWTRMFEMFRKVGTFLEPAMNLIATAFHGIGAAIGKAFSAGDFNSVYDALNTGLLTGIVLLIRNFFKKGINIDFGGGLVEGIKNTFETLTGTLKAMQTQIQAKTLMTIAGAIALLTVSVVALSLIDSDRLSRSLTAMAVAFGQLLLAMSVLTKISGTAGFVRVPIIAASMILLAGAVVILTAAVRVLSGLSWGELAKGLVGVGALLLMIVGTSAGLGKASGSMLRTGLAMVPLAIGIRILADAVQQFSTMSWGDMAKGLAGIAAALVIIAGAVTLMPASMILQAAGLVILSVALLGIGKALQNMGGMSWGEIAKGLVTLAGSLLILAGGLYLMTGALPGAAAVVVVALALAVLAPVLILMATMSWTEIGKGMTVLASSLLIMAVGLTAMSGTLLGSAALVIAAAALAIIAPILITLGAMSWGTIAKGLIAIAASFVVLGGSALLLAPLIPAIFGLSAALLVLGVAMSLIGVGALALASAFSIFVAAGSIGISILGGMIDLIPQFLKKFAEGIIGFATTIASQAGKFVKAFTSLLNSLLDAIIQVTPKLAKLLNVMIDTGLNIIIRNAPKFARAALDLLMAFLNAVNNNINRIVPVAANIIIRFLQSMNAQIPRIARVGVDLIVTLMRAINEQRGRLLQEGANMIISFINQLASTIRGNSGALGAAGGNLAAAIISGIVRGLFSGAWSVASTAASVARQALAAAKGALGIHSPSKEFEKVGMWSVQGMSDGFIRYSGVAERSAGVLGTSALDAVKKSMRGISDAVSGEISLDPVITPVLDLSQVIADAANIQKIIGRTAVVADISFNQANGIANNEQARQDTATGTAPSVGTTTIEFTQNNTSPKPLDPVEIYRNTRNQLSLAREALTSR